jgi:hypothetical protein
MNRVSARFGVLVSVNVSADSKAAAINFSAEFFAPEMGISPFRRAPPLMMMRSMKLI